MVICKEEGKTKNVTTCINHVLCQFFPLHIHVALISIKISMMHNISFCIEIS